MRVPTRTLVCAVFCALAGASTAHAQLRIPRGVELTAYGGGIAFGDFHEHAVRVRSVDGDPVNGATWRRAITASASSAVGAAVTYWATPLWGVRLHAASLTSRLGERYEEEVERLLRADPEFVERPDFAPMHLRMQDIAVMFRVPARVGELSAYALAGVGRLRYTVETDESEPVPPGARRAFGEDGRFSSYAGMGGIGAHYPLGRFRLVAEATNHIGRSPVRTIDQGEVFRSERLVVEHVPSMTQNLEEPGERTERVNTVRYMLGITVHIP